MTAGAAALALTSVVAVATAGSPSHWRQLAPGVAYAVFENAPPVPVGDGRLHVVRVDPDAATLRMGLASAAGGAARTARAWCETAGLSAAINLGMFGSDYLSNVGYAADGSHVNQRNWAPRYQSVLVAGARHPDLPAAALLDLDTPGTRARVKDYRLVVQNLRLIKAPRRNVWSSQHKRWSEAAVAMDREGRILFLFSRSPYTMWEFNRLLLSLPLDIVSAMHVEGGPEASLSIHTAEFSLDLNGSYETGFQENDSVDHQWPIPNVLGIANVARRGR